MDPLLAQGLELTLVGMIVVFGFLVALVGVVRVMSFVVGALGLDPAPAAPIPPPVARPGAPPPVDARTLAVIQAAIRQHRGQT